MANIYYKDTNKIIFESESHQRFTWTTDISSIGTQIYESVNQDGYFYILFNNHILLSEIDNIYISFYYGKFLAPNTNYNYDNTHQILYSSTTTPLCYLTTTHYNDICVSPIIDNSNNIYMIGIGLWVNNNNNFSTYKDNIDNGWDYFYWKSMIIDEKFTRLTFADIDAASYYHQHIASDMNMLDLTHNGCMGTNPITGLTATYADRLFYKDSNQSYIQNIDFEANALDNYTCIPYYDGTNYFALNSATYGYIPPVGVGGSLGVIENSNYNNLTTNSIYDYYRAYTIRNVLTFGQSVTFNNIIIPGYCNSTSYNRGYFCWYLPFTLDPDITNNDVSLSLASGSTCCVWGVGAYGGGSNNLPLVKGSAETANQLTYNLTTTSGIGFLGLTIYFSAMSGSISYQLPMKFVVNGNLILTVANASS